MMDPRLQKQLERLESAVRRAKLWRHLAVCWLAATALCVLLWATRGVAGWNSTLIWSIPLALGILCALVVFARERSHPPDFRALVAELEREHPDLRPLLSTAIEQQPDVETGEFHFLQRRVINAVVTHRDQILWRRETERKSFSAMVLQTGALIAFVLMLFISQIFVRGPHSSLARYPNKGVT